MYVQWGFAILGMGVIAAPVAQAATVTIVNDDGPGEGLNDGTPVTPVGGNPGTTVGQQRINAFQFAGDIWGARLSSTVPIRVAANFDVLPCTSSSGTLGSAGFTSVFRDFTGAIRPNTWYAPALANALHGSDLTPGGDDIVAQFNSNVGTPGCLDTLHWYYGLDANPPPGAIDFVTVVLHELGHGLGFLTVVDLSSGAKLMGFDDTFMVNLQDQTTGKSYPAMTDAERFAASKDTGNLHWVGPNVRAVSGVLTGGKVGDHVQMYAPNPQQGGSSVSHWSTMVTPNQLMEPSYTGPIHNPGLETPLFQDVGWVVSRSQNMLRDFNGDRAGDILWRDASGNVAMWLMDGTIILTNGYVGNVSTSWAPVGFGDFNGDGKADILWRDTSGNLALWLMNGTTILANSFIGNVPTVWVPVSVGDFDGDGRADILWRDTSGNLAMWRMNGTTILDNTFIGSVPTAWTPIKVGDFNGDGKADILWRDTSGNLAMWLMNGPTTVSNVFIGNVSMAWTAVKIGDFNGDGKGDILWRDTSGNLAMWLMNGTSIVSNKFITNVSGSWTPQ